MPSKRVHQLVVIKAQLHKERETFSQKRRRPYPRDPWPLELVDTLKLPPIHRVVPVFQKTDELENSEYVLVERLAQVRDW